MDITAGSKIRPENYITIQGWMITELGLRGSELVVYACIYGFSQSGENGFIGSPSYLAEWANCSRQNVYNILNSLISRGLVRRNYLDSNGITLIEYTTGKCPSNLRCVQEFDNRCPNTLQEGVQEFDNRCPNTLHNNNNNKEMYNNIVCSSSSTATTTTTTTTPSVEEVSDYFRERGYTIDPQRFWDVNQLRDWKNKNGKPLDWKTVARLWESKERKTKDKQSETAGSFDTDDFFSAALRKTYGG